MLLNVNNTYIDTDYPEEYIDQVKSFLPSALADSIALRLEAYKGFDNQLSDVESQASLWEARSDRAKEVRDRVQELLFNLMNNGDFDHAVLGALKFIKDELNDI